jgi:predicted RNA methylase
MKLKQLESILTDIDPFENPKIDLEQVCTSPHIAARMIFTAANSFDDIEGCNVGDFGCGPGILSIASSLMGASG